MTVKEGKDGASIERFWPTGDLCTLLITYKPSDRDNDDGPLLLVARYAPPYDQVGEWEPSDMDRERRNKLLSFAAQHDIELGDD